MDQILQRLKPPRTIKKDFYVFDVETIEKVGERAKYVLRGRPENFYFGVIYSLDFVKVITSVEDFKKEFEHPRYKRKKVFAHNAEYDLNTLYSNIFELDPNAIFNQKFIACTNGNCNFADSLNIYQTSVKKLGELMKLSKLELNRGDLNKDFLHKNIPEKDIEYCIRDCEIVYKALLEAFEFAGQINITQASLSMSYFRRFHMPYDIAYNDNNKDFFSSYYGGRTEVFKIGQTHSSVYDLNSSYPFSMKETKFPNPKNLTKSKSIPVHIFIKKYLYQFEGLIECDIEHKDYWLGFLPFRKDGKLFFPVGKFSGHWNFNEIRFALKHNIIKITHIYKVVFSEPMESIFTSFVDTLYNGRFSTDDKFEQFRLKIYMNSLYGKFAQKIDSETIYIDDIEKHIDLIDEYQREGKLIKVQMFSMDRNDAYLVIKSKMKTKYSIPSFASYITSNSRILLLDKLIKSENNKPVYCDTDSVFLEIPLHENPNILENGIPKLGAWKLENKLVYEINGLKNYKYKELKSGVWEKLRRLKGVPIKANEIQPNVFTYDSLVKTKESLRRNLDAGTNQKRTKVITNKYDKRIVKSNGETLPIKL